MTGELDYILPFNSAVLPVRISQGHDGPYSHFIIRMPLPDFPNRISEKDLQYAVDFALPLGSVVTSARSGRISCVWRHGNWCYQGLDPSIGNNPPSLSTNFVAVDHEDGTQAIYSHLSSEPIVHMGQIVRRGEPIAHTGRSGWIARIPHLHFQVNDGINSISVTFDNYVGSLDHTLLVRQQ